MERITLTESETRALDMRLRKAQGMSKDRKAFEQIRMATCIVARASRRASRRRRSNILMDPEVIRDIFTITNP